MYKLLIVEDDMMIAKILENHLEKWGYEVKCITDFEKVYQEFLAFEPHLVLLDISLPFFNGFHWCGEIRKVSKVPIVFISSASDNMNIVMAINMGADDFVDKPFDLNVITAKIQALLRRTYSFQGSVNVIEHKGVVLNLNMDKNNANLLVIEDTGIGISAEDLPRVAERGFTGYNGRSNQKSTGLGLYLTKEVLGKLGHGLKLESQVGKGTKVIIDFSREFTPINE